MSKYPHFSYLKTNTKFFPIKKWNLEPKSKARNYLATHREEARDTPFEKL